MPSQTIGASNLVYPNQNVPDATSGEPVSWRGQSMLAPTVVPLLPGLGFNARGLGRFDLSQRVSGRKGAIDILVEVGADGSARTICYLTDNPSSPTRLIAVGIDALNRPTAQITNNLGTVVASVDPSFGAIESGSVLTIRLVWDSVNSLGSRHAAFSFNQCSFPDADWIVNPTSAWTFFQPTHLVLGFGLSPASDFNGSILSVQVSNDAVQETLSGSLVSARTGGDSVVVVNCLGTMVGWGKMHGSSSVVAACTGHLVYRGELQGSSSVIAACTGNLIGRGKLRGSSNALAACTGNLIGRGKLRGSSNIVAACTGNLTAAP